MTRYVPRNLRDDGMIEAQEVAHYSHLTLQHYYKAADVDAELAAQREQIRRLEGEREREKEVMEQLRQAEHDSEKRLFAEMAQVTAQFEDMKLRNRLLRDRTDLPIERIRAYDDLMNQLATLTAERDALKGALKAILEEPYGCPFCDSGKLRNPNNPAKGHTNSCGFYLAQHALGGEGSHG